MLSMLGAILILKNDCPFTILSVLDDGSDKICKLEIILTGSKQNKQNIATNPVNGWL